jgi:hypothetical protein
LVRASAGALASAAASETAIAILLASRLRVELIIGCLLALMRALNRRDEMITPVIRAWSGYATYGD